MKYPLLPTGEILVARSAMPKTADGYIVALQYVPPHARSAYEAQWREWATVYPRTLWPDWLIAWADGR